MIPTTIIICPGSETSMFQCDDEADGDGLVVTIDAVCDGNKDCNDTGRDELNILCSKFRLHISRVFLLVTLFSTL